LLLQSSDDVRHVGELALLRPHFRFDAVQLPCPTLRTAEPSNRYGLSVMQPGQLLAAQRAVPPRFLMRPVAVSRPPLVFLLCSSFVRCHARRFAARSRRARIWLRFGTLATQGGRDTASTQLIPATSIDAFVGRDQRWPMRRKPGRSTTDNRGLAHSVPALNFAL
jgi:hypothetical protein